MSEDVKKVAPPAMPLAPTQFDRSYQDQLNNVLRLYFNRLTALVNYNYDAVEAISLSGYVPTTRTVTASTGLTGGGDLSANISFAVSYGATAGTAAQGNDSRIVNGQTAFDWGNHNAMNYALQSVTATAGTGLTGGGTLAANFTFNVVYGTTAGTAAQGNDSRINNGQTAFGWGDHAGLYLPLSGGSLTNGLGFGSAVAASVTDVTRHLALYATSYGFNVTSSTLNVVASGGTGIVAFRGDALFSRKITETTFAVTGTTPALTPVNGTVQTWLLSGNSTPTFAATFSTGSSLTLMIDDGTARTITWPAGLKWAGGAAPTLATTGYTVVELWCVGTTYYGALVGEMA